MLNVRELTDRESLKPSKRQPNVVQNDGYRENDGYRVPAAYRVQHISAMGERQVVGVGGTRPLRNVLGEALKGRFSFEARNHLFSFPSYVHFEEFFVSHAFAKFERQTFEPWDFLFRRCLGDLFENCAPSLGIFWEFRLRHEYFLKISSHFSKQSRCYLPDSYVDPQAEQSSLVMVRRN